MSRLPGDPLGTHRVIAPMGVLPQAADVLDAGDTVVYDSEIVVAAETVNLDAASFRQMSELSEATGASVTDIVLETVRRRGKQHNPVTGSGGMLLGTVRRVGSLVTARGFAVGDRVVTLASLTLTPLSLDTIRALRPASAQLDVVGTAYVFATAPLAKLPTDFSDRLAVAVLDVAGAAPLVSRLAKEGATVAILGAGGKSGLIAAAQARRSVGPAGHVLGIEVAEGAAAELAALGDCDSVDMCDARDAIAVQRAVMARTAGRGADLTVSCVNVSDAESAAILATRDRGAVCFFATTTRFTAAALGAEGMSRDVDLIIGNGYAKGHADHTLNLIRTHRALYDVLTRRYA